MVRPVVRGGSMDIDDKNFRPSDGAKSMPGEKQKKITPDKSGKGKHKVEEDKTSDTTKPPTDPKGKN